MPQAQQHTTTLFEQDDCLPDGPVPGFSQSGVCGETLCEPHEIERTVQRALLMLPDVRFSSLEIHRMENGVCLTGVMCVPCDAPRPPLERIIGRAAGIAQVLNHLVVRTADDPVA